MQPGFVLASLVLLTVSLSACGEKGPNPLLQDARENPQALIRKIEVFDEMHAADLCYAYWAPADATVLGKAVKSNRGIGRDCGNKASEIYQDLKPYYPTLEPDHVQDVDVWTHLPELKIAWPGGDPDPETNPLLRALKTDREATLGDLRQSVSLRSNGPGSGFGQCARLWMEETAPWDEMTPYLCRSTIPMYVEWLRDISPGYASVTANDFVTPQVWKTFSSWYEKECAETEDPDARKVCQGYFNGCHFVTPHMSGYGPDAVWVEETGYRCPDSSPASQTGGN